MLLFLAVWDQEGQDMEWLMNMQVLNLQMIYSGYGCTQGWFCTTCSAAPRARWGPTHRVNPSNFCGPKGCCKYMKVTVLCSRWTPSYSSKLWGLKDSSNNVCWCLTEEFTILCACKSKGQEVVRMIGSRLKFLTSKLYVHFLCVLIGQPWLAMESYSLSWVYFLVQH